MAGKNKRSILSDYMRDAYEEFAELVCNEIRDKHPKKKKLVKDVEGAVKAIIEREFGKDPGGYIDL